MMLSISTTAFASTTNTNGPIVTVIGDKINIQMSQELNRLDNENLLNLNEVKRQLGKQSSLNDYAMFEKIINNEYTQKKNSISSKYGQNTNNLMAATQDFTYPYSPNGGQVHWDMYDGSLAIGSIDQTYFSPTDTKEMIDKYETYKYATVSGYIAFLAGTGIAFKSLAIGLFLTAYGVMDVSSTFINDSLMQSIKDSRSSTAEMISTIDYGGHKTSALVAWSNYALMSVPLPNATYYRNITYKVY